MEALSDEGVAWPVMLPTSVTPTVRQFAPVLPVEEACHRVDQIRQPSREQYIYGVSTNIPTNFNL